MSVKIYTSGNYFYIEEDDGNIHAGLSKNVLVEPSFSGNSTKKYYTIHGVKGWSDKKHILLSDIVDEAGNSLTYEAFKAFYESESGKASAGSSAGTTELSGHDVYLTTIS